MCAARGSHGETRTEWSLWARRRGVSRREASQKTATVSQVSTPHVVVTLFKTLVVRRVRAVSYSDRTLDKGSRSVRVCARLHVEEAFPRTLGAHLASYQVRVTPRAPSAFFFMPLVVDVAVSVASSSCAPPELCDSADVDPAVEPLQPRANNGLRYAAHAHNDYEHDRPLLDALDAGFASVEADVWFRDGDVVVSHDAITSAGTLDDLYLEPLAQRLGADSSVHGDGAEFVLWLDLKDGTSELREGLAQRLEALLFVTRFDDDGVVEAGAVTVILTGDDESKTALVDETPAPRAFARDDNALSVDDDEAGTVVAAALNFGAYVGGWDGQGSPPDELRRQCGCVVERAHALNRRVRLFSGSDTPEAWALQRDVGVDFINTDDLDGLAAFLEASLSE